MKYESICTKVGGFQIFYFRNIISKLNCSIYPSVMDLVEIFREGSRQRKEEIWIHILDRGG